MANRCEITGKILQFGHNVSHSNRKTNRTFDINIQKFSFYSFILKRKLKFYCCAAGAKVVDKFCGIDNFVLQSSKKKLFGKTLKLRKTLMKHKDFVLVKQSEAVDS